MKRVENLNAPSLNGWIIAAGAGVLAFVIAKVVGQFDYTTSGFFAALVTGVAGLVIGMPWGAADRIPKPETVDEPAHAAAASAPMAAPSAPAAAAPVAEASPVMAAPVVSAPVADAPAAAPVGIMSPVAEPPKPAKPAPKAEEKAKPAAKAAPKAEPAPPGGSKPKALKAPRKGVADDLKVIEGIGPAMEKLLHDGGIFHIDQIAAWGPAEVEWMDGNLKGFKGRVTRDKWVAQAKLIGEVGLEEFLIRAKTNNY